MSYAPTSELEAVNVILSIIGDSPVNTLSNTGLLNVDNARQALNEASRTVQAEGWVFNTEYDFPIQPDINGFLTVPANTLRIDPAGLDHSKDYVLRGTRLYDRANHTYVFTKPVLVDLIVFLDWTDLPETAREYIKLLAARKVQERMIGSSELDRLNNTDLNVARANLVAEDIDNRDNNMFTDSYTTASITGRRVLWGW